MTRHAEGACSHYWAGYCPWYTGTTRCGPCAEECMVLVRARPPVVVEQPKPEPVKRQRGQHVVLPEDGPTATELRLYLHQQRAAGVLARDMADELGLPLVYVRRMLGGQPLA